MCDRNVRVKNVTFWNVAGYVQSFHCRKLIVYIMYYTGGSLRKTNRKGWFNFRYEFGESG